MHLNNTIAQLLDEHGRTMVLLAISNELERQCTAERVKGFNYTASRFEKAAREIDIAREKIKKIFA